MNNIIIRPMAVEDAASFHACVDAVAREAKFLAMLQAPPLERTLAFVEENLANGFTQFVAHDGHRVVGWCDILPQRHGAVRHCGTLAMGLLPDYRGKGLGRQLITACIAKAPAIGVTRIELEARADNEAAIRLYERAGFVREGLKKNGLRMNGEYFDAITMALLLA